MFLQVGDFGLSKIKRNTLVSGGVRGTLPWMAPELLNGSSSKVSEKVMALFTFIYGLKFSEKRVDKNPFCKFCNRLMCSLLELCYGRF